MSPQCVSERRLSAVVGLVSLVAFVLINCSQTQGQTLVIQNQSNKVYSGLRISTSAESGLDCIQIAKIDFFGQMVSICDRFTLMSAQLNVTSLPGILVVWEYGPR